MLDVYRNYPIGSLLLWNSDDTKLTATRNVCGFDILDRPLTYPVKYVLDGQQRISAIYAVFCKDRTRSHADEDDPDLPVLSELILNLSLEMYRFLYSRYLTSPPSLTHSRRSPRSITRQLRNSTPDSTTTKCQ